VAAVVIPPFSAFSLKSAALLVVNVLEEKHQRELELDPNHVSLEELKREIGELKLLIIASRNN
jgi:hypothetical protein